MTDERMMTMGETCRFFGGQEKPLDKTTLYRWIRLGKVPKPVKLTIRKSRWRYSECLAAIEKMQGKT